MKDPVEPGDLDNLDKDHLDTLEKIIRRELHNVTETRKRLEKALEDIQRERDKRDQ